MAQCAVVQSPSDTTGPGVKDTFCAAHFDGIAGDLAGVPQGVRRCCSRDRRVPRCSLRRPFAKLTPEKAGLDPARPREEHSDKMHLPVFRADARAGRALRRCWSSRRTRLWSSRMMHARAALGAPPTVGTPTSSLAGTRALSRPRLVIAVHHQKINTTPKTKLQSAYAMPTSAATRSRRKAQTPRC